MSDTPRCAWPGTDPLMLAYHDTEWGVPVRDDRKLFEFIVLDSMQAGLSWRIILHKREGMRAAFAGFDPGVVATFTEDDVERLAADPGIIRNRPKIRATITNAQAFLAIQAESGSFARYLWGFVDDKPVMNRFAVEADIPASTPLSDRVSQDLKARGFKFAGTTITYAFMQGAGLVNDHVTSCFRHAELMV